MNTCELWKKHQQSRNPCNVQEALAPGLVVTCYACDARLEAALLSPCVGDGEDERVLLMLECPSCGSTGQVRFQRDAFGRLAAPVPPTATSVMTVAASGPGYLGIRCGSCDPNGGYGVLLTGYRVTPGELVLGCASLGCGHPFELRLPRAPSFRFEEHRHHAPV